ncbi:MAG: hypothetical protein AB7U43_03945 [Desulfobacter sp.]
MVFIKKLFSCKTNREKALENLEEAIDILRIGIFSFLHKNFYSLKFNDIEASFWAVAVLNTMYLLPPANEKARIFYETNEDQIWQETLQLKKCPDLSGKFGSASYLYFSECYFAMGMKTNPNNSQDKCKYYSDRITELVERAELLGIYVLAEQEIRTSNNPLEVIDSALEFAIDFREKTRH